MEANEHAPSPSGTAFSGATEAFHAMISRIRMAAASASRANPGVDRAEVESKVVSAIFDGDRAGKTLTPEFIEVAIKDAVFEARGRAGGPSSRTRARVKAAEASARRELGREPTDEEIVAHQAGTKDPVSLYAVRAVRAAHVSHDGMDSERMAELAYTDQYTDETEVLTTPSYVYDQAQVQADAYRLMWALEAGVINAEVLARYDDRESWDTLLLELRALTSSKVDLTEVASVKEIAAHTKVGFTHRELATMLDISVSLVKKRVFQQNERLRAAHPDRAMVAA